MTMELAVDIMKPPANRISFSIPILRTFSCWSYGQFCSVYN